MFRSFISSNIFSILGKLSVTNVGLKTLYIYKDHLSDYFLFILIQILITNLLSSY